MSSLAIRSFGVPKEDDKPSSDVYPSSSAGILPPVSSITPQEDEEEVHNLVTRTGKDYVEPWVTRIFRYKLIFSPSFSCVDLCDIRFGSFYYVPGL